MSTNRTVRQLDTAKAEPAKGPSSEKLKALQAAVSNIERTFGKGTIMKLGDQVSEKVPVISTGSLSLDRALGIGGLPRGRVVEIYGPEASGKTTLTLQAIAQAQKAGGTAAFVDVEHAFDPTYASQLGVNLDELYVAQPDTGEQALEIVEALISSSALDIVVVDSVAALVPRAEIDGEMGDTHVGLQARLMSQALRKLTGKIKNTNTLAIFINQLRMKIGAMMPGQSPETTTGGNALKYYASVRLDIRRIGSVKKGDEVVGNEVKIKVVKNKMAPPFKEIRSDLIFGFGISREGELIDLAVENKVIDKSGAWFTYGSQRWQGKENTRDALRQNADLFDEVLAKVKEVEEQAAKAKLAKSSPGSEGDNE